MSSTNNTFRTKNTFSFPCILTDILKLPILLLHSFRRNDKQYAASGILFETMFFADEIKEIPKEHSMTSIVLGQYDSGGLLRYMGHVTLGVSRKYFARVRAHPRVQSPPFSPIPKGNENAVWIKPDLLCTVSFMERTESGSMRQPVFKGLREDKQPTECKINE